MENYQNCPTTQENNDDYRISIEEVTDSEEDEDSDYTEILQPDIIPYQPEPPDLPPAPPWSRALLREVQTSCNKRIIMLYLFIKMETHTITELS